MTDIEIIQALECCKEGDCDNCNRLETGNSFLTTCIRDLMQMALDLINRQQAENDDLFYKLHGVMLSVDKWLGGDELKQDEVNRVLTMREKTLQIIEKQQREIELLKGGAES